MSKGSEADEQSTRKYCEASKRQADEQDERKASEKGRRMSGQVKAK